MTNARLVWWSLLSLLLFACPTPPGSDGGTGGGTGGGGGTLDSGVVNPLPEVFESAYGRAVAVRGGKVYVAGNGIRSDAGSNNDFFVARFNLDLTRDTTFGVDGVALAVFDGGATPVVPLNNDFPVALTFDGDKPLLAGGVRGFTLGSGDLGLARFTADGQPDPSFGTGGLRADSFGRASLLTHVIAPGDGGIVVAGTVANGSRNDDLIVLRYTSAGAVDTSFTAAAMGSGGVFDCGFNNSEEARGLVLQGDKVVLGGGGGFCMARVQATGPLDLSFGPNGTGLLTNGDGFLQKFVQRTDGTLWGVGNIELNRDGGPGTEANFLKQVLVSSEGVAIPAFGTSGRRVDLVPEWGALRGAALQSDGKLLIYFAYIAQGRLLRLNVDGSLDTTFGMNGMMALDIVMPLFEGGAGKGNHLAIEGNTAWIVDIRVVQLTPSRSQQQLALVKVSL